MTCVFYILYNVRESDNVLLSDKLVYVAVSFFFLDGNSGQNLSLKHKAASEPPSNKRIQHYDDNNNNRETGVRNSKQPTNIHAKTKTQHDMVMVATFSQNQ
jgi:hypothetical protein